VTPETLWRPQTAKATHLCLDGKDWKSCVTADNYAASTCHAGEVRPDGRGRDFPKP